MHVYYTNICLLYFTLFSSDQDKDSYSVYLCDTNNEDEDIHLHQALINEEYAESCSKSQFDITDCNSSDV